MTVDPTAKRDRRLVELRIDGETVDPDETYSVATFRRPGDPERDLGNCGVPFRDVAVDDVEIEALHTPGHTSEMMNFPVDGGLLLTGDTPFADSVERTELQFGEDDAPRGADLLYDSLHGTDFELPADTTILPGDPLGDSGREARERIN